MESSSSLMDSKNCEVAELGLKLWLGCKLYVRRHLGLWSAV